MDRRKFLQWSGSVIPFAGVLPAKAMEHIDREKPESIKQSEEIIQPGESADYAIRINTGLIEVGPQQIISTTTHNGQFPGPVLRFNEGQRAIVDIYNDAGRPEQFHWHGQFVPPDIDGAAEERTPYIPAHGMRREVFTPNPAGFRFYHTHVVAANDLSAGQYNGQIGPVYIEPEDEPGHYDREEFIALKEFDPCFMRGGDMAMDFLYSRLLFITSLKLHPSHFNHHQ